MRLKKHFSKGVFKRRSSKPGSRGPPQNQVSIPPSPPPPPPPLLFSTLPVELCILILTDAARISRVSKGENTYSTALVLCRVSRAVRSIVLPELLHTVLLSRSQNVSAFTHALNMQNSYGLKGNDLYVPYLSHVRNIWIGEMSTLEHQSIDVSLLAPVLLAAKSLALEIGSIPLLDRCLTQEWKPPTRFMSFKRRKPSRPPWSTTTLTLVGNLGSYQPTTEYADESLRSTFFDDIQQFVFLPPISFYFFWRFLSKGGAVGGAHLPAPAVDKFPWTSLKSHQTTVLACPVAAFPSSALSTSSGEQLGTEDVEAVPGLLKVPSILWDKGLHDPILKTPICKCHHIVAQVEWEQTWACRLSDEKPFRLANGLVELSIADVNTTVGCLFVGTVVGLCSHAKTT